MFIEFESSINNIAIAEDHLQIPEYIYCYKLISQIIYRYNGKIVKNRLSFTVSFLKLFNLNNEKAIEEVIECY